MPVVVCVTTTSRRMNGWVEIFLEPITESIEREHFLRDRRNERHIYVQAREEADKVLCGCRTGLLFRWGLVLVVVVAISLRASCWGGLSC